MIEPTRIEIGLSENVGYVWYSDAEIVSTTDVWDDGQVAVDYDAVGKIVGIEVLGLDAATLGHARTFAEKNGLVFPAMIERSIA